jgi:hypothetical protein
LIEHGHDADWEIACNPAADLEETNGRLLRHLTIPLARAIIYSMPERTVCTSVIAPVMQRAA